MRTWHRVKMPGKLSLERHLQHQSHVRNGGVCREDPAWDGHLRDRIPARNAHGLARRIRAHPVDGDDLVGGVAILVKGLMAQHPVKADALAPAASL
jgi:hypothetical protein